jgi:hypothetical protein
MRVNGRLLRPSSLAERRIFIALGIDSVLGLRVPRNENPFALARRFRRLALAQSEDMQVLKGIVQKNKQLVPHPSPEVDLPTPLGDPLDVSTAA